ncbi:MAG: HisA/HisF-related TIM barrel protein [Woeseiaceae bacterium]|nr:HisA/HisF-related TIM barrel protein [Woeseiaceae bacterium]
MKLLPAIDLQGGYCVRLFKGEFDRATRYGDDPLAVARRYRRMGFEALHIVDLDGARSGHQDNRTSVARLVAESGMDVQLGGGIRHGDTVDEWFDAGVSRLVIGSLAVLEPARVQAWMGRYGADRFVLALDCRCDEDGTPWLATHGWTRQSDRSLWDCLADYAVCGASHILCTDVSRDGAMTGPALDLYREFVFRFPALRLQASGGVRNIDDLHSLREIGAAAAVTGRAVLDGCITAEEIATFRQSA